MRNRQRMHKRSMTGHLLLVIAKIADENGEFNPHDAVKKIEETYPSIRDLYATSVENMVSNLITRRYTEWVSYNRHRIPFSTLDFMEVNGFSMERMAVSV